MIKFLLPLLLLPIFVFSDLKSDIEEYRTQVIHDLIYGIETYNPNDKGYLNNYYYLCGELDALDFCLTLLAK